MHEQHQHVFVRAYRKTPGTHGNLRRQVEHVTGSVRHQPRELVRTGLGPLHQQLDLVGRQHPLHRFTVHNGMNGPQNLVPVQHICERRLQRPDVQRA